MKSANVLGLCLPFITTFFAILSVLYREEFLGSSFALKSPFSTSAESPDNFQYRPYRLVPVDESLENISTTESRTWSFIGTSYGVNIFTRQDVNFQRTSVKGVGSIPLHISSVLGVFWNTSLSSQWIGMLGTMQDHRLERKSENATAKYPLSTLVYQKYNFPYPIASRDFVLRRDILFNAKEREIVVKFKSIEDKRFPATGETIRATTYYANWLFRAEGNRLNHETFVSLETLSDLKGGLPAYFVNYLQRSWPAQTINSLRRLSERKAWLGLSTPFKTIKSW